MRIRVTGDSQTGRLLGPKSWGRGEQKFQNELTFSRRHSSHDMRVEELSDLDLSYTPPLSSPWDPVQMAAQHWAATQARKDGDNMQKVIFACVHNAGRSQMSAAFFNQFADPKRALAISAGTQPAEHVHPVLWKRCSKLGLTSGTQNRKSLLWSWRKVRRCSSPWAAEMIAPTYRVCAATTGHCRTPRIKGLIPFGRLAKRFEHEFWSCLRERA